MVPEVSLKNINNKDKIIVENLNEKDLKSERK